MTHNTAKGDMRVVRDEMEKKREEGRAEWVRAQQREAKCTKKPVFSFFFFTSVTIKQSGTAQRHCQHVRCCTICHSLNKSLVMLCCPDPTSS